MNTDLNLSEKRINILNLLSASTLKIFACIFMFIDHCGVELYPYNETYRIIGRLAYPIFAFFMAEGCKYTKNRLKRFLTVFLTGVGCEIIYIAYSGEYYGNIMLTFSLAIILIYAMQEARCGILKKEWGKAAVFTAVFGVLIYAVYVFCGKIGVDYGFWGVMTPVLCSVFMFRKTENKNDSKWVNLVMLTVGLVMLTTESDAFFCQRWSLLAVIMLALYNGEVGIRKMKYAFYVFYPLHLGIIGLIAMMK